LRKRLRTLGIRPQINKRQFRGKKLKGRPIKEIVPRYQQERSFAWFQRKYRRLVVRWERLKVCFDAFLLLACSYIWFPEVSGIGYVPVNDCAPFAVAWEKGFFRKYGLNVNLSREASWGTSRDGIIFGRLDASPVVCGAVTNARTGAEGARHAPLCAAMTLHRHGNALTMNKAMWESGLRPWREYNGDLDEFGRDFRRYFDNIPPEKRVWAVVLSSAIYEYFVRYLSAAAGVDPEDEFRVIIIPPPSNVGKYADWGDASVYGGRTLEYTGD
jgi:hypothetical protein